MSTRVTPHKFCYEVLRHSNIHSCKIFILFSADEKFDGTYQTNVVVGSEGHCLFIPPGIFKVKPNIYFCQTLPLMHYQTILTSFSTPVNVQDRHHLVSFWRPAVRPQVWVLDLLWVAGGPLGDSFLFHQQKGLVFTQTHPHWLSDLLCLSHPRQEESAISSFLDCCQQGINSRFLNHLISGILVYWSQKVVLEV